MCLASEVCPSGVTSKQLVELRRPDNACMESGAEFDSAHAYVNFPAVAFKMTDKIRQILTTSVVGGVGDNVSVPSKGEEVPPSHREVMLSWANND